MNIAVLKEPRHAKWIVIALFAITIISRIPFVSQYLYHTDSVNMAFGMIHFNPADGAPHFPGYIFYIIIADLLNPVFGNANTTLVIISIVSSGAAVGTLFYLGREMFDATIGLIAAVFLMTSPLVWFYGDIALPHTLDMFMVTMSALLLYKIMDGETRLVWIAAIFLGVVGGFRYVTLGFLMPLMVFAGYRNGMRRIIGVGLIIGVITVIWVIPTLNATGGLQNYMTASSEFSAAFFGTTSQLSGAGLFGLNRNLVKKLLPYTAYAWGLAALPMVYFIPYIPKWRHWITDRKVWFFALWIMPSVGFYILIHMGQQGYVFAFLPACLILSAKGLYGLLGARPALLQASTAVIALVGAGIFIFAPVYPFGPNGPKLLTYATLRESDQIWSDKIAAVRSNFKPDNTLLVAGSWRHIQYYLPEYRFARFVLGSKFEADEGEIVAADFVNQAMPPQELGLTAGEDWRLVVIDDELKTFVREPDALEKITLPDGFTLSYLTLQPDEDYWTDGQTFGARAASAGQG